MILSYAKVTILNRIRKASNQVKAYHDAQEPFNRVGDIGLDEPGQLIGRKRGNYRPGLHRVEEGDVYLTLLQGVGELAQEVGREQK